MSDPIVYGFPRSTFVNIVRLILTHKDVALQLPRPRACHGQTRTSGAASVQPRPDPPAWRSHRLRDERDCRLCRRGLWRRVA